MKTPFLVALLSGLSLGARVPLSNIGMTVDVPDGWTLTSTGGASWQMEDTVLVNASGTVTARHAGMVQIEAMPMAASQTTSAWIREEAYAWRLFLENNPCYGWVFRHDSTLVDNRFAMLVQGEWATCPDTTQPDLRSNTYSILVRTVAQGSVGWELSVISDTADFADKYFDYRDVLDSVHIDPNFISLAADRTSRRELAAFEVRRQQRGWLITSRNGADLSDLRVVDASGRSVGILQALGDAWLWIPGEDVGVHWVVSRGRGFRLPVVR